MRVAVLWWVGFTISVLTVNSSPALAAGQGWEIELHGGGMVSGNPAKGTTDLPPPVFVPSPPLPIAVPPTRVVPSWFFGDGAALLNQIAAVRPGTGMASLDAVLQSRFVERRAGSSFGARVSRSLGPRFAAEFAIDEGFGALALTPSTASGIKASEASFLTTWSSLLGVAAGTQSSSDATIHDNRGRQIISSGALLLNLHKSRGVTPYVALGAGIIATRNQTPSVELVGHYHFNFPFSPLPIPIPILTIDQTDTVTMRTVAERTVTWVIGGGVKYAVADRWGVRVDVRDHVNKDPIRTIVDATPTTERSGSAGILVIFFAPNTPQLQFSTFSGSPSSLDGSPVVGFKTFVGKGIVNQVNVTAGVYLRF
jgi:hypothetical protein